MVFKSEGEKQFATLQIGDGLKTYRAKIEGCGNPLCQCNIAHIHLTPLDAGEDQAPAIVPFDLLENEIAYADGQEVPPEEKKLAEALVASMSDADIKTVHDQYFFYKRLITETADIDALDPVEFPVDKIENEGYMILYREIFPYGKEIAFSADGKHYLVEDQYCLRTKCGCSHAILTPLLVLKKKGKAKEFTAFKVDYKTKKWEKMGGSPLRVKKVDLGFVKDNLLAECPNLYREIERRHRDMKKLYAKFLKSRGLIQAPSAPKSTKKVGRNDPCPCGSGKKYKKCCLNK